MTSLRFLVLAAALAVAGCGKKAGSPSSSGPGKAAPADADPVALARTHAERGENSSAVLALGTTRNDAALELLLPMLEKPHHPSNFRRDAVRALAKWPDRHERIGEAFAKLLPDGTVEECPAIAQALAGWGLTAHAPVLARMLIKGRPAGFRVHPFIEPLRRLATPALVPILLEALPVDAARGLKISGTDGHYDTVQRALPVIDLLGDIGDARAVPSLVEYLNIDAYNHTWRPASVALGKIGSEEGIVAIEKRLAQPGLNEESRRDVLAGLWHSHHARGRAALERALAGDDLWDRVGAAEGLAATARAGDEALVLGILASPDPRLRQRVVPALPRLLPGGRSALEQGADRAQQERRFRTALVLAEALGDAGRRDAAAKALEGKRSAIFGEPRLDRWLGKTRADVLAKYPDARPQAHVKRQETSTQIIWTDWGSTFDVPDRLAFWGGRDAQGPFVGVGALPKCADPVFGVRVGDPAEVAWELHGLSQHENEGLWGQVVYKLTTPDGTAVKVTYAFDLKAQILAAEIRSEDR